MQTYISVHNHTEYSKLDGKSNPFKLAQKAKEYGMDAIAMTDHRCMDGMVQFYKACTDKKKGVGIKPIIGCEVEETEDRTIKNRAARKEKGHRNYHMILLARNEKGHKNLMNIVSDAAVNGLFDRKERTDFDFIRDNNLGEGLYATTACVGGRVSRYILEGKINEAKEVLYQMINLFDQVFLELQPYNNPEQTQVNQGKLQLAKELNLPLIITCDSHYITPDEKDIHDTLLCMQTGTLKTDPKRFRFSPGYDVHLWSPQEMWDYVQKNGLPIECITNTIAIAKNCNVELKFDQRILPNAPVPVGYTPESYLTEICKYRIWDYLGKRPHLANKTNDYLARLDKELNVICSKGYASYFLILSDIVSFCKSKGIPIGPGRGSSAASIVARLLYITDLDPIEWELTFERFLNPERDSMPDIDTDICYFRRAEVIEYCKQKYIHVAQIANNLTSKLRSTIQSVFRVYDIPTKIATDITKLVPAKINQIDTTWEMMKDIYDDPACDLAKKIDDREVKTVVDNFKKLNEELDQLPPNIKRDILSLEGIVRGSGIHAGGILLCDRPIEEFAPLTAGSKTAILPVCSLNMKGVDEIGLLKVDLLGSRSITVIDQASRDIGIDWDTIDLTDAKVWKGFQDGHYHAIFQMQGGGMTKTGKELKLECFDDLINLLALFRPGPLKGIIDPQAGTTMVQQYTINRYDPSKIAYEHPDLAPILSATKGMLIFQEQLMIIVQKFAGYSLGGADTWRRAVGKKDDKLLQSLRDEFINGSFENTVDANGKEIKDANGNPVPVVDPSTGYPKIKVPGCVRNGYSPQLADYLFKLMEFFSGYGFNKAHSAVYALNAYRTMYLKIYHAVELMRAALSSESDSLEKVTENLKECKRLGIKILPPDINKSDLNFTIEENDQGLKCIRYGLSAVKMIGEGHVAKIKATRPFNLLSTFASVVPGKGFDRRHVCFLIMAGAFDQFDTNRYKLLNEYNFGIRNFKEAAVCKYGDKLPDKVESDQAVRYIESTWDRAAAFEWEKELLGSYVTGHPYENLPYTKWEFVGDGAPVEYGGRITRVNKIITKTKQEEMAFFTLETAYDMRDVTVFPNVWAKDSKKISEGKLVIVRGTKDYSNNCVKATEVVGATKSALTKAAKQTNKVPIKMPTIDPDEFPETPIPADVRLYSDVDVWSSELLTVPVPPDYDLQEPGEYYYELPESNIPEPIDVPVPLELPELPEYNTVNVVQQVVPDILLIQPVFESYIPQDPDEELLQQQLFDMYS